MTLVGGSHCFLWGSMVALLYAGAANLHRDINHSDPETPLSNSAPAEIKAAITSPDARAAVADPVIKVAPAEPDLQAESLGASDVPRR
jgi:hypothetical protein